MTAGIRNETRCGGPSIKHIRQRAYCLPIHRFMRRCVETSIPELWGYGFAIRLANSPYPVLRVIVLAIGNRKDVYE